MLLALKIVWITQELNAFPFHGMRIAPIVREITMNMYMLSGGHILYK